VSARTCLANGYDSFCALSTPLVTYPSWCAGVNAALGTTLISPVPAVLWRA